MSSNRPPLRRVLFGAVAILAAAGAAIAQAPRARPDPTPFAPGFALVESHDLTAAGGARVRVFTLRRMRSAAASVTLVMAIVPKRTARVEVRPVLKEGLAREVYPQSVCPGALAAINGSFFYHDAKGYRPMGLVRIGGATVQDPSPRTSGGFLASNGRTIRIVPKRAPGPALAARYAVESSPILIQNGRNGMRRDDQERYDRVAVGAARGGDLVMVGAFAPAARAVSLWEFESLARAAATALGEDLADVLAMDGGPSAHLFLPGVEGGKLFGQPGRIYTPNMVCIGVG